MKNRRNLIVAFLLCACLIVGIGYAALSQNLTVNGKASISADAAQEEFDEDVYFSSVSEGVNVVGEVDSANNDNVILTINDTMGVTGDTATIDLTIKNEGNANVTVTVGTNTGDGTFKVVADSSTYSVPANGEAVVKLTITLTTTIDSPEKALTDKPFGITFTATSAG